MIWSPHCICKEGFYRLPNGTCVSLDDPECEVLWRPSEGMLFGRVNEFYEFSRSFAEQCIRRGNEVFNWGSACQKTCEEVISDKSAVCPTIIDCYCPEGMVRSVADGECIAIEECFPIKLKLNLYS